MNKFNAWLVSGVLVLIGIIPVYALGGASYFEQHGMTAHMIFWYMLWKQFHDKKKDE